MVKSVTEQSKNIKSIPTIKTQSCTINRLSVFASKYHVSPISEYLFYPQPLWLIARNKALPLDTTFKANLIHKSFLKLRYLAKTRLEFIKE